MTMCLCSAHCSPWSQTAAQLKHGDLPQIWADVITKNITVRLGNLEVVTVEIMNMCQCILNIKALHRTY